MTFAICFDLPTPDGHLTGTPVFAGQVDWHGKPVAAFYAQLANAARFDTEQAAEEYLATVFGANVRQYGAVVELDGERVAA